MTLLIPIDRAAVSYQPNDLKSVRRAARPRFPLIAFLGELVDLRSTFRDAVRFKFVSLGEKRSSSWRHWGIKSNGRWSRQGSAAPPIAWLRWPARCENGRHSLHSRELQPGRLRSVRQRSRQGGATNGVLDRKAVSIKSRQLSRFRPRRERQIPQGIWVHYMAMAEHGTLESIATRRAPTSYTGDAPFAEAVHNRFRNGFFLHREADAPHA
jgi:hypothetical protein